MSPQFLNEDIDQVRERSDIIEVIGEHVRLKRAGRQWRGLCPFHEEKTPSLYVDPDKKVYHCLAGDTQVLTGDGSRPIGDLAGTSHHVLTIAAGGASWVEAPFYSFGDQPLMNVVLTRNGLEKVLQATPEHRWFLKKGKTNKGQMVKTEELRPGQTLTACFLRGPSAMAGKRPLEPSPFGIARGITFGDGTRLSGGSVAYLHGAKDAELRRWFPLSASYQRDGRTTITDLPAYFKDERPPLDESRSYLYGWLAGYFAADGNITDDCCISLDSAKKDHLEYVRDLCTRIGIATYGMRRYVRKGIRVVRPDGSVTVHEGPIYRLTIAGDDLTPDFFLLAGHRTRFESYAKKYERRHWVVRAIEPAGKTAEVFCPVVPTTHAFALEDNILTGNCHGCHAGGSVFTFLEQAEGLSFPEAVESLAQKYGVELRETSKGRKGPSPRARLYAVQDAAVQKYREALASKDAETVRAYLESRGITSELIDRYSIGFGGWRRDALVKSMLRSGYRQEELMQAGLASRDAAGVKDTFHGRVLFPIFDPSGRPVGFGGRVLPEGHREQGAPDGPKYLNSRESPVFKKSSILYGTNWARVQVMERKRLVVVEGYTDVIALHAAGVGEAVATCGTSLTEDHMKEISRRFGDVRVVLCLDADAAGQAAMSRERTEELAGAYSPGGMAKGSGWLPMGRGWLPEVNVANLPQGKDPADFVRAEGADGVGRILDAAAPLVEFLLRRALDGMDPTSPDGRTRAVRRGVDVLRQIGDSLLRHEYALWLADRAGVEAYEISRALESAAETAPRRRAPTGPQTSVPVALSGAHRIEREALRAILTFSTLLTGHDDTPAESDFTLPMHRSLFRLFSADAAENGTVDVARITSRVQDAELRRVVSELSVGEPPPENVARDTLRRLRAFTLDRHIVERKSRMRSLDPDRDAAAYDALFEELLGLEKQKRSLATG